MMLARSLVSRICHQENDGIGRKEKKNEKDAGGQEPSGNQTALDIRTETTRHAISPLIHRLNT